MSRRGMTVQEAGRKGGLAPHVCRGRQCDEGKYSYNNGYYEDDDYYGNGYYEDDDYEGYWDDDYEGYYSGYSNGYGKGYKGMTVQEAGRKGGLAPHICRGFQCQELYGVKPGSMTPEEAGHLGGIARHICRGRQCDEY